LKKETGAWLSSKQEKRGEPTLFLFSLQRKKKTCAKRKKERKSPDFLFFIYFYAVSATLKVRGKKRWKN